MTSPLRAVSSVVPVSQSETSDPSQLIALPLEIKREILSYLHFSNYPALAILRRTHSSFFHIIPKSDIRSKASKDNLFSHLIEVERKYPTLLPPNHYTCFECVQVLPKGRYSTNEIRKGKGIGAVRCYKRFCLSCGVTKGRYARGVAVPVGGLARLPCKRCGHFFYESPSQRRSKTDCDEHIDYFSEGENGVEQAKVDRLKKKEIEKEKKDKARGAAFFHLGWWNLLARVHDDYDVDDVDAADDDDVYDDVYDDYPPYSP